MARRTIILVIHIVQKYLAQIVKDLPEPQEFNKKTMFIKGNNMAKASMEMLLYDYHAKVKEKPLAEYMGKSRGYANVGISLGMDDINVTLKKIQDALNRGYKRIKVKIMKGKETQILGAVRDQFPDITLSADANSDYTEKDFQLIKKIDRYDLIYLEQPLYHDDIIYHSRLAKEISTPLCLDESITSPEKSSKSLRNGGLQRYKHKGRQAWRNRQFYQGHGYSKEFQGACMDWWNAGDRNWKIV